MNTPAKPAIDVAAGVARLRGDQAMFDRVLRRFADSFAATPDEVREALARHDGELAVRLAHTLKGAAGTIGAGMLQEAALRLEQSLRSGTDDCDGQLDVMATELQRVLREIGDRP
jgi:HPt (histidine-containing phosphotransfer) domain-containing protein